MPISVTPSKLVDIDVSDAGPDDLLQLTLEDGSRIYLRVDPSRSRNFRFDEDFLPDGVLRKSRQAAKNALTGIDSPSSERHLEEIYERRDDKSMSIIDFVAHEMRRQGNVRGDDGDINVGDAFYCVLQARFQEPHLNLGAYHDRDLYWRSPSLVGAICATTRFQAQLIEAQKR